MDGATAGNRYVVRVGGGAIRQFGMPEITESIRRGFTTGTTLVAPAGSTAWQPASKYPELQELLERAAAGKLAALEPEEMATVTPARLIAYLALAGLIAAKMMSFMLFVCVIVGAFGQFVLTAATLGAVLGLGINSAFRENDPAVINIPGAGFAAGGALAWLMTSGNEFKAVHLVIIGICGAVGLAIALRLPINRAAVLVVSSAILLPLSISLTQYTARLIPERDLSFFAGTVITFIVPGIPFAIFGAVLGAVIAFTPGARARSAVTA